MSPLPESTVPQPTASGITHDRTATQSPAMPEVPNPLQLPWRRQRIRVPRDNRTLFAVPSLDRGVEVSRENHARLNTSRADLQGRTLEHLRQWARTNVYGAALAYTSEVTGQTLTPQPFEQMFVAGHQPSLFHPGVWVKNFAIDQMAARNNGCAVNLVVDNDTFSSMQLRVPAGDRLSPSITTIPFDEPRPTGPWEGATIQNRQLFDQFGRSVQEAMGRWNIDPLVGELWPDALEMCGQTTELATVFTGIRNRLERRWGLNNLELPISRLCALEPFLWFASHILAQLPRFREIHNEVLGQYRVVNRVRSRTHPVPELKADADGWLEAPFWVWHDGDQRRGRLYCKQVAREVWLSDGTDVFLKLPLTPEGEACCAVEALQTLPERGIHLRTRALTTTLFARLCLGDLFVHGIGGAKYDEMTDRIIARFYQIVPPGFQTLSATIHLPLAETLNVHPADESRLRELLREQEFNPQRLITPGDDPTADALVAEKLALIAEQAQSDTQPSPRRPRRLQARANHSRYMRLREINRELALRTEKHRQSLLSELESVRHQLAANAVLTNREFSYGLYPADTLREFMDNLWSMPTQQ